MRTALADLAQPPVAVPEGLCPLIDALGTPEFGRQLRRSVDAMLGAGAAAVYAAGVDGPRLLVGDWAARPEALQRHTGEYAHRYASHDPAFRAFGAEVIHARRRASLTVLVERDELPDEGHRRLLAEAGFSNRIVTVFPAACGWLSLHILRRPEHGVVGERELQHFAQASPVFASLIGRHLRSVAPGIEARLLAACPRLTPREAAVCASLLRGESSRDIARRLAVAVSSVQTYRKRAYRKLGIASLPQAFLLVLGEPRE